MVKRSVPRSPQGIRLPNLRLRPEPFDEWCTARGIPPGDPARARFLGIHTSYLWKLRYGAVPGGTFIAAACLAFADQNTPAETFEALFEILPEDCAESAVA